MNTIKILRKETGEEFDAVRNIFGMCACCACGENINTGDPMCICSDCGGMFCRACVESGEYSEHECDDEDDVDESVELL